MLDAGVLTRKEADGHPDADLLERAIGHAAEVDVEIGSWVKLREGDQLLLCSDGLCGYVQESEIEAAMSGEVTTQRIVDDLVKLSLAEGGNDNVTVQVLRYGNLMPSMSPGRIVLWQAAFLPLSALVAGVTTYALLPREPLPAPSNATPVATVTKLSDNTTDALSALKKDTDDALAVVKQTADVDRDTTMHKFDTLNRKLDELKAQFARGPKALPPSLPQKGKPTATIDRSTTPKASTAISASTTTTGSSAHGTLPGPGDETSKGQPEAEQQDGGRPAPSKVETSTGGPADAFQCAVAVSDRNRPADHAEVDVVRFP